jgi:DHA1 family bicyclomycin/chloramphenicol resistance-like MFS transporter
MICRALIAEGRSPDKPGLCDPSPVNKVPLRHAFMTSKKYFLLILILGTLSAIGPFSIDMYLPGFPSIAADLHTTVAKVSLSLSSFFIGISAGQLLYGPLLDRFGRKNPLYFGLSLYIIASVGCAMAVSPNALIGFRFLQAIGGCAGMVASRAMVRDIFPVNENAKIFSLLMLVVGVSLALCVYYPHWFRGVYP